MVRIVNTKGSGRTELLTSDQKEFLDQDMTFINLKELCVEFKNRFKTFSDHSLIASKTEESLRQTLRRYLKKKKYI
jgi:hypothetical protein